MKLKFSSPATLVTFQMLNSYTRPGATIGTEEITTFPSLQDAALEPSCLNMVAISHMWLFFFLVLSFQGRTCGMWKFQELRELIRAAAETYVTATAAQDLSHTCDPCCSSGHYRSLTHWGRSGIEPHCHGYYVRFSTCWATMGTPTFVAI